MALSKPIPSVGLGAMSLCINDNRPSLAESIHMIESLIGEHGLTYIDTADCYALGEEEFGYGERLVAPFMGRDGVTVASKIGMTRTGKAWGRRGDPAYLRPACESSLKNLGVESIELCQFHTPDPSVPIEESIGEMARLREEGKIQNIGVSNFYSTEELDRALAVTEIVSIQNPLSILFYNHESHEPFVQECAERGVRVITYAPMGGHRQPEALQSVEPFVQIADAAGLSVHQLALLFLKSLSPTLTSIPGSISKEHIINNLSVNAMALPDAALARVHEVIRAEKANAVEE